MEYLHFIALFTFWYALLGVPYIIIILWIFIAIIWTPFGGLICAVRARSLGLPAARFALAGAVLSLAMFLPWMYLMRRMNGKRFSNSLINAAYIILYVTWTGTLGFFASIAVAGDRGYPALPLSLVLFIALVASIILPVAWIYLAGRMDSGHIPQGIILVAYAILYAICAGLVATTLYLGLDSEEILIFSIIILPFSFIVSLIITWFAPRSPDDSESILPPLRYVFPFALLSLNTLPLVAVSLSGTL